MMMDMSVYVCERCKRFHTHEEFKKSKICRNCGTLLSRTTPPPKFDSPHTSIDVGKELIIKEREVISAEKRALKSNIIVPPTQFKITPFLGRIKSNFGNVIVGSKTFHEKPANYATKDLDLTDVIKNSLRRQGIEKLYVHQAKAIEDSLKGRNVVIATPTASGKTLCFNIPVLDSIVRDCGSCAFYIYPTKALAQDQIRKIAAFRDDYPLKEEEYSSGYYFTIRLGGQEIALGKYEGPTPKDIRGKIRESCNIVLTNPDELHLGILRHSSVWSRFLKNLKYLVLDEVHVYRGIFGSHVALILRRLRKLCEVFGAKPVFILCSATIGNPLEHAQNLTGCKDFVVVDEEGSPRKRRTLILWNPPLKEAETGQRIEALTNVVDLLTEVFMDNKQLIKTMVFGRSRLTVKLAYKLTQLRLKERKREEFIEFVREYTATLPPERREKIFADLTNSKICTIIGTNALELGIDIPDMSGYLSIGYPGSFTSVLQQFGRVGRVGEGLGIIVLRNEPLEQYFSRNPHDFFEKEPEDVRINPDNPEILRMHLACCVHELSRYGGLRDADFRKFFGEEGENCKRELAEQGKILCGIRNNKTCWKFNYGKYDINKEYLPIRNPLSKNNFTILCGTKLIGIMDYASVLRDLHPGAIWIDNDKQYEVVHVNFENFKVKVQEVNFEHYTISAPKDTVSILREHQHRNVGPVKVSFGTVQVKREVTHYCKVIPGKDREKAKWKEISWNMPVPVDLSSFSTEALWLTLPNHYAQLYDEKLEGALHAIEHALLVMVPKWVSCDPNDIKGAYNSNRTDINGNSTIFIFDNYPGGIGLARACFEKIGKIILDCIQLIETCGCKENSGCPSCIQTPRCEKRNENLDKKAALEILKKIGRAHPSY